MLSHRALVPAMVLLAAGCKEPAPRSDARPPVATAPQPPPAGTAPVAPSGESSSTVPQKADRAPSTDEAPRSDGLLFPCDGAWVLRDGSVDCVSDTLEITRSIALRHLPAFEGRTVRLLRLRTGALMVYVEGGDHPRGAQRLLLGEDGSVIKREIENPWLDKRQCDPAVKDSSCTRLVDKAPEPSHADGSTARRLFDYRAEGWWQAYVGAPDGLCINLMDRNVNAASEEVDVFVPLGTAPLKSADPFAKPKGEVLAPCKWPGEARPRDEFKQEDLTPLRASPDGAWVVYGAAPVSPGDYAHSAYFALDTHTKQLHAIRRFALTRAWKRKELEPFIDLWRKGAFSGTDVTHDPEDMIVEDQPYFAGPRGSLMAMSGSVFSLHAPGKVLRGIALIGQCPFDRTLCRPFPKKL